MTDDEILNILRTNSTKHPNDSRQIIKYKNNVLYGNELGIVLSNINSDTFEVFMHFKYNKEVISQILYKTFNNIKEATDLYNRYDNYVINFDIEKIIEEINN